MSALGAGVGKAVGGLGGPQIAAIVVAGGLLVGAIGGGLAGGGGTGQQGTTQATLSIYPCPDSGPALATVGSGQKFLVTGKNADGSWARIYYPLPGRTEAWVPSGPLQVDGSLDAQPVVPCAPVVAGPGASVEPSSSLTAVGNNSPSPGPTAEPTITPSDSGPTLARFDFGTRIAGGPQRYCERTPRSITVSVRATDASEVASVVLAYRKPGAADVATKPMVRVGGSDTWRTSLATDANGITGPGSLRLYVSATDRDPTPHTSRLPARSIDVVACANTGPTLASLRAAPGTVSTNLAACQSKPKATAISVEATDVDGVDGATLHYRLPGDNSYRDAKMTKNGNRWRTTVTPVDQRPNADGKASYYVTSDDDLGESSRSATQTFTVNRCNFPAAIRYSDSTGTPFCPQRTTRFFYLANDRDGLTASSATFIYMYRLASGKMKTAKVKMSGQDQGGNWFYTVDIVPTAKWALDGSTVTFHVQTKDRFGGISNGGNSKTTQSCP